MVKLEKKWTWEQYGYWVYRDRQRFISDVVIRKRVFSAGQLQRIRLLIDYWRRILLSSKGRQNLENAVEMYRRLVALLHLGDREDRSTSTKGRLLFWKKLSGSCTIV